MSIQRKLLVSYLALALLAAGVGWFMLHVTRQIAHSLVRNERHFQEVIVGATEAVNYSKRAEGHLMLFLTLQDAADRKKFIQRCESLREQVRLLDQRVAVLEARAILDKLRANADKVQPAGLALLDNYDRDLSATGRFEAAAHSKAIREFQALTSSVRALAEELTIFETDLDSRTQAAAIANASRLQRNALLVLFAGAAAALLFGWLMARNVSRPIIRLIATIGDIGGDQLGTAPALPVTSDDEVGALTAAFNRMVELRRQAETEREKMHQQLLESSRQAGMAEVATSVLHNVGNVLNSVNVASSCVADSLRQSQAGNLARVVALMREHEADMGDYITNDPRGSKLPDYLAKLSGHLAEEQAGALKELAELHKNIEHIKDIVSTQQSFARAGGVTEIVKPADLAEAALRMNATAFERHDIQVVKEFSDEPAIATQRHKVLQILINLLRNAKQACNDTGREDKRVTVRIVTAPNAVRIAVTDNGIGIPAENLARIFQHGFTTKKDGHGFGLHSGALAARELGGVLMVESPGLGKGATFTLELPTNPKSEK